MKLFGNKENEDKSAEEWMAEGQKYYDKNKYKNAVECYQEVLKQDPDNAHAWGEKGISNYKLKTLNRPFKI